MTVISSPCVSVTAEIYDSVTDLDASRWDSISPTSTGLTHKVLSTFELSGVNDLVCNYILLRKSGRDVGKANIYQTAMNFTTMAPSLSDRARKALNRHAPGFLNFSMAECGLFAMNGDGLVADCNDSLIDLIRSVDNKLHDIANNNGTDLLLFRDITLDNYETYERVLSPNGYVPVLGFTNAVIDIEWSSLEDYLSSLNSKARHKLKSALKISEKFDIKVEITSDYAHLAPEMAALWSNVSASSTDYSREQLDEAFFYEAGSTLGSASEAILFFHDERLVAFMWNLIGETDYHMADWGVDYDFPNYRGNRSF